MINTGNSNGHVMPNTMHPRKVIQVFQPHRLWLYVEKNFAIFDEILAIFRDCWKMLFKQHCINRNDIYHDKYTIVHFINAFSCLEHKDLKHISVEYLRRKSIRNIYIQICLRIKFNFFWLKESVIQAQILCPHHFYITCLTPVASSFETKCSFLEI